MAKTKRIILSDNEEGSSKTKGKRMLDKLIDTVNASSVSDDEDSGSSPVDFFKSSKRAKAARDEALHGFRPQTPKRSAGRIRAADEEYRVKTIILLTCGITNGQLNDNNPPSDNVIVRLRQLGLAVQNLLEGIRIKRSWDYEEVNEFLAQQFKDVLEYMCWQNGHSLPWVFCFKRNRRVEICADKSPSSALMQDFSKPSKKASWSDMELFFGLNDDLDIDDYEAWLENKHEQSSNSDVLSSPASSRTAKGKGKAKKGTKRAISPTLESSKRPRRLVSATPSPSSSVIILPEIDEYPSNQLALKIKSDADLPLNKEGSAPADQDSDAVELEYQPIIGKNPANPWMAA